VSAEIVIAGSGGFIGKLLTRQLDERGIETVDVRESAKGTETAKLLVNLANIPDDPAADLELLDERLGSLGNRVDRWLQTQSFITLQGHGQLDLDRFNAGFRPTSLDHYGLGKLSEERRLVAAAAAGEINLTLAYLSAVLDDGGPWARVRAQAERSGYVLPRRISAAARANFVYVADLADVVVASLARPGRAAVTRLIVNDPLSRTTTWGDLLGGRQLGPGHEGRAAELRREARDLKARAAAWRLARAASDEEFELPSAGERPPAEAGEPAEPRGPFEFSGVLLPLVRYQGFLPPTPI
jgi:hypothetical protein